MDKKKILTINWSGEEGSIVKIISDIEENSRDKFEYYHVYQIGKKGDSHNYLVSSWNVTRFYYMFARLVGLKYGVGTLSTLKLLRYIEAVSPDIIHIHCPNFYSINLYLLFDFLKRKRYKVIITNHAEFYYTGNCAYALECEKYLNGCHDCKRVFDKKRKYLFNRTEYEWRMMKKSFSNADDFYMTVVSPWQFNRIKTSPLTALLPVKIIENAVNTRIFKLVAPQENDLKLKYDLDGKKIILNVTANFSDDVDDLKGGYHLIHLAKMLPQYLFVIAGNVNIKSKESLSRNLLCLGNVQNQVELAKWYNIADLTVLTSKRETYGMACAESLACGTPVVGFKAGGTESIALEEHSEFCEYGDREALCNLIGDWIERKNTIQKDILLKAQKRYCESRMVSEYVALYENITSK